MEDFSKLELDETVYEECEKHRLASVVIMRAPDGRAMPLWKRDWQVRGLLEKLHSIEQELAAVEGELYNILINVDEE